MKARHLLLLLSCWLGFSMFFSSCHQKTDSKIAEMEMHEQFMSETYVDTMRLHVTSFDKQVVCNGFSRRV